MGDIILPVTISNGTDLDADEVMANFDALLAGVNGGIDSGNISTDAPVAQTSVGGISEGSSASVARADHRHILQGMEQLSGDPTSGNFIGREYFDTTNKRKRLCISAASTGTFVTTGNLASGDLPNHASRHSSGGPDALANGSVSAPMLSRTVSTGVPSGDVTVGATAWVDVVTGVTPTITGTQVATIIAHVGYTNTHASNLPTVNWRVVDASANVLGQTGTQQLGTTGSNNDGQTRSYTWVVSLSASPTLKLQVYATTTGVLVRKSTSVASTPVSNGNATQLQVLVG